MSRLTGRRGNRRYTRAYEEEGHHRFGFFYKIMMMAMILIALTLGYRINEKQNYVNLTQLKNKIINLALWFPFEGWFEKEDSPVSALIQYQLLKDNYYVNGSNQAAALMDGVVLSVSKENHTILLQHDNGVLATYGNLDVISVLEDERIQKGNIIASFEESLTLDFIYDGMAIDYQQMLLLQ